MNISTEPWPNQTYAIKKLLSLYFDEISPELHQAFELILNHGFQNIDLNENIIHFSPEIMKLFNIIFSPEKLISLQKEYSFMVEKIIQSTSNISSTISQENMNKIIVFFQELTKNHFNEALHFVSHFTQSEKWYIFSKKYPYMPWKYENWNTKKTLLTEKKFELLNIWNILKLAVKYWE